MTATDLFCGAGGSSLGLESAGVDLRMAANHWALAVESHQANFPHADHDTADVSQVVPERYPSTDILLASPECTTHSLARGGNKHEANLFNPEGDPRTERSRATMWDVPRFAEFHQYQIVIVENVVEIRRWLPYQAWLEAMRALGYEYREVFLNSMVAHPTPQSRDRIYVVFWRKENRAPDLDFRVPSWCPKCEASVTAYQSWKNPAKRSGKYRQQYVYRCGICHEVALPYAYPAASAIDWDLPAQRIAERTRPLAAATLRRIQVGLERFGAAIVQKSGHTYEAPGSGYYRVWPTTDPVPTQTTEIHHGLVVPLHHGADGPSPRSTAEVFPTQTGRNEIALVPFLAELRGGSSDVRPISEPTATVCASGNHLGLVIPYRGKGMASTTDQPLPTQDTRDRFALVLKNYGDGRDPSMAHSPADPFGAVTTQDHHSVVEMDRVPLAVEDCGFRMLEPHEIKAAMAFPAAYIIKGSKRDQVRQAGNAVTPPAMTMLVRAAVESLNG
jgi:DNA (cytosine-5)-methyltransferase 1